MASRVDNKLAFILEDDLTSIRKIISDVTADLAGFLVDEQYCHKSDSLRTAAEYLSDKSKVLFNDDGSDDEETRLNDEIARRREKLPKFLMIIASQEPVGSQKRENEDKQFKCEAENFLKRAFGQKVPSIYCPVGSYDEMKKAAEEFFRSEARSSNMPFVVFLGHGGEDGKLVFFPGEDIPPTPRQALQDLKQIFLANKAADMPRFQLRVVFTQCYAHLIDRNDASGIIQVGEGIEYIYFTCEDDPTTESDVRITKPDTSR